MLYEVTWTASFIAVSPEQAAQLAQKALRESNNPLSIFHVRNTKTDDTAIVDTETGERR